MAQRYEIRLAGSGGQGLILAGMILAEAAGIYDGKFVCQTQSYGPEARGGASKAEVVISDAEIDYPKAIQPDVLLALNQKSLDTFTSDLKPGGLLLVDADLVQEVPARRVLALPFTRMARELGRDGGQYRGPGGLGGLHRGGVARQPGGRGPGPGAQGHRGIEPPGPGRRGRRGPGDEPRQPRRGIRLKIQ